MLKSIKKQISILLICIITLSLIFEVPISEVSAAGSATINLAGTKQKITGFGASSAWCGTINDTVMNSLYSDLGYSILRLRIEEGIGDKWKSGNYSAWASELSNAKKASANGAIVFASPWNPPAYMQESFTKSGDSDAKRLKYDKYDEYVQYLNAYVKYMKDNGVNLYAISVQNEPDYANDWTWWTSQEMLNFMKNNAGSINCKVMAPESFQYRKDMSNPILNDSAALNNLDVLGLHLYGTQLSEFSYPLFQQKAAGKELWMTEHYYDNDNTDNLMKMGKEIHDCMVTGNMNAYVYWWITWPNGLASSSGTIYKRAYVLGQFAKFIRPGYNRVDATANPNTNVYVSAYTGDNKAVIVAVNTGTSAVSQKFNIQNGSVSKLSTYTTSSSQSMASGSSINVSGGSFDAQLPAQSITTFVGDLGEITSTDSVDAYSRIEAENYDNQSGTQNVNCSEGGEYVGYIENGDYTVYKNVNFDSNATSFQARVSSATNGGNIELRLDSITGSLVGTCSISGTNGWENWVNVTCNVSGASGKHDLYLKYTGQNGYLFNINWFNFGK
ncbi:glucuronoarabinoxylan endo-1,4-beta-xylanase [Lachnotalea glycerini]|uniref:Glucuronoarabinoxylan endo-1,4-beta-xylanase n=1 Tax=Lachnotalea glycerini TaxID=1763509 RepID=A0A318EPT3_9FIRM|nr:carbohydrate-binding protein [Lachnotalea glycerini]PXV91198.1 glucuronoarabinoxylan endo-1,4-beta-xylanase [Lachnotalea glycerini]